MTLKQQQFTSAFTFPLFSQLPHLPTAPLNPPKIFWFCCHDKYTFMNSCQIKEIKAEAFLTRAAQLKEDAVNVDVTVDLFISLL